MVPDSYTNELAPCWRQDNLERNPTCQGASRLSDPQGLCQWHCHQNIWGDAVSVQTLVVVLGSSGAQCCTQGLIGHGCGHPCAFPAVPGGVDPNASWILSEQSGRKEPKASRFVTRTNAPSGMPLMLFKCCLIEKKLFLSLKKLLPFFLCSWRFRWRWFCSTIFINYVVRQRENKSRRDLLNYFFVFLLRKTLSHAVHRGLPC